MEVLLQLVMLLFLLTGTVYAQSMIPAYTDGSGKILLARAFLIIVGIGFGLIGASYVQEPLPKLLAFLIGFGLVHLPAAIVLLLKGMRGEGKS